MNANQSSGMGVAQVMRILLFFAVLVVSGWILYLIRGTLLPFGIAFILSYLLVPLVDYIESYRLNRLVGVAVVLVSILTIFVSASILLIPIVAKGMESLMVGFVGQKSEWPVLMVNRSEETIKIEEAGPYGDYSDFSFVNFEPFDLKPGERDTLTIQFKPTVTAGQQDSLRLVCFLGSDKLKPIKFHLIGNRQNKDQGYDLSSDWFFKVDAKTEAETDKVAVIELSGIIYRFGSYSPGYLDHVNIQLASLQPELEESFPFLEEVNLAQYAKEKSQSFATDMLKETPELLGSVLSGATFVIIVPLVLFFFLGEGRTIKRAFIEMIPNRYFEMVLNLLYRIDIQLGGYIRGMVMSVFLISLFSVVGLWTIGLDNFLVVGIIAGVSNVIPYLGPLIGIITGAVAGAIQYSSLSMGVLLPVIVVFLIVQILDNVFVAPVVVARSVNLHPLIVIFVVLVGSQLFGAVGMVLAVPATAVVKVSAQTIYEGLRSYSV